MNGKGSTKKTILGDPDHCNKIDDVAFSVEVLSTPLIFCEKLI